MITTELRCGCGAELVFVGDRLGERQARDQWALAHDGHASESPAPVSDVGEVVEVAQRNVSRARSHR